MSTSPPTGQRSGAALRAMPGLLLAAALLASCSASGAAVGTESAGTDSAGTESAGVGGATGTQSAGVGGATGTGGTAVPSPSGAGGGSGRTCPAATALPLRQRLAQTLMVSVDGSARPQPAAALDLGGVFVWGNAVAGFRDGAFTALAGRPIPPLVAVDEEGGRVQRIDDVAGSIPSARRQAATLTPAQVQRLARARGERLRALGVTVDLAPVVDLDGGPARGVIGDRSYAADAARATAYAGAFAAGLQQAGIIPTLKHFPGHGRASGDSHRGLPTTPRLAELERRDLLPYRRLLSRPGPWIVMVGHLDVPGLTTAGRPASLDPAAYAYLRDRIGFDGPVLTDELTGMRAVSDRDDARTAAREALAAGADLVLLAQPGPVDRLLDSLEEAVRAGTLPEARVTEAADRVLAVKTCPAR